MGYGDDLLITAFAAKIKKKYPDRQIVIGNSKEGTAFYSRVWDHNPNIADCRNLSKNKPVHLIDYHSENRPYIDHEKSTTSKEVSVHPIKINDTRIKALTFFFIIPPDSILILM